MLMINHGVDTGEFLQGGGVVVATSQQDRKDCCCEQNDDGFEVDNLKKNLSQVFWPFTQRGVKLRYKINDFCLIFRADEAKMRFLFFI